MNRTRRAALALVGAVLAVGALTTACNASDTVQVVLEDTAQSNALFDCLRDMGYVGRSDDHLEALYPTLTDLHTCQLAPQPGGSAS